VDPRGAKVKIGAEVIDRVDAPADPVARLKDDRLIALLSKC
jgi:hypothetical protein